MGLNARKLPSSNSSNGPKQEPIEPGTYPVRVVQVLDLGLQNQRAYQGKEKPPAYEISITYEFLDEFCLDEDGKEMEDKPRWLSETVPFYSLEVERAKSTKRYYAIDPNEEHEGDFTALVGSPVNCTVVNNKSGDRVYTNVESLSAMRSRDAAKAAELVNPPKVFTLDEPDMEVFKSLPEWIQDKIKGNLEYQGSALQAALEGGAKAQPKAEGEEGGDDEW